MKTKQLNGPPTDELVNKVLMEYYWDIFHPQEGIKFSRMLKKTQMKSKNMLNEIRQS